MDPEVHRLVHQLELHPHPEGGFYRETYRSSEKVSSLPPRFSGPHCYSTCILYLLEFRDKSRLHRIKSDEVWHFYDGMPLRVLSISPTGERVDHVLSRSLGDGHELQACVPAGYWFGARVLANSGWSLVGCTVAPGFEFSDLEMANRAELLERFPAHADVITDLSLG